jgi:hypothetical protein
MGVNSESFLDTSKSLNEGAVQVPVFSSWERDSYAASGFFDNDKKLADYGDDEMQLLLHGSRVRQQGRTGDVYRYAGAAAWRQALAYERVPARLVRLGGNAFLRSMLRVVRAGPSASRRSRSHLRFRTNVLY